jgi:drug/metabolite transporter (DMT)-like permease
MTPTLGLLLASALWGGTFVVIKEGLSDSSPLLFVALRFWLATAASLALFPRLRDVRRVLARGAALGVVLAGGYATQTLGLVSTTPSRSAFITGLNVSLVPLWALAILGQRPGWGSVAGLSLAIPGLWLLAAPGSLGFGPGEAWTTACAALFALHVVLLARWARAGETAALLVAQLAVTALLCTAAAGALEIPRFDPTPRLALALLSTSVLATAGALWLQLRFQPRVDASRAAMIYATEPVFAALFALAWGEKIAASTWLGGGLIALGAVVSEWDARRVDAPSRP